MQLSDGMASSPTPVPPIPPGDGWEILTVLLGTPRVGTFWDVSYAGIILEDAVFAGSAFPVISRNHQVLGGTIPIFSSSETSELNNWTMQSAQNLQVPQGVQVSVRMAYNPKGIAWVRTISANISGTIRPMSEYGT